MNSVLIYKDGDKKVNVAIGEFAGYKNLIYNNLMDVAFEPEGSGKLIFRADDFIFLKLDDPAPEEVIKDSKNLTLKIKFDEKISTSVYESLVELENFTKIANMEGFFLTFDKCIDYEIDLEKQILTIFRKDFSYAVNYNFINTFIENPGDKENTGSNKEAKRQEDIDIENNTDIDEYHKNVEENRKKRTNKRFRI